MFFRRVLIIAIIGLMAGGWLLPARADGPLVLTADQGEYPLGLHLWLLADPSRQLGIEQVSSPEFAGKFSPSTQPVPNFGYTDAAHWARIELTHALPQPQEWLLEVADPTLNSVTLYTPAADGLTFTAQQTGDLYPRSTRPLDARDFVFTVPLQPRQTQTIYLRVENSGSTPLPLTLWSQAAYAQNHSRAMFGFGFFYGFIFIMVCYNLMIFSFLREATYLFYVATVTGFSFYFASLDGLAAQYVWPNLLWWGNVSILVFIGLTLIGGIGFTTRFLSTAVAAPAAHRALIGVQWVCGGLVLLALWPALYRLVGQGLALITVVVCVMGVALGAWAWRAGFQSARYFLLAWGGLFLGAVIMVLSLFGLLPANDFTANGVRLGIFLLVLFLSLALADRINLLRREAEQMTTEIKETQNRFRQFLEAMPVGVCLIDTKFRAEFLNQRGKEILALTQPAAAEGFSLASRLNGALKIAGSDAVFPAEQLPFRRALQGDSAYAANMELKLPHQRIPLEMWARPVFNDQGQISYAAVAFQDISERRQAEEELSIYRQSLESLVEQRTRELEAINHQLEQDIQLRRQKEEQLRILSQAVEQSVNTILITDLSGNIEYVNPTVFSTTGYTPQEVIGKNPNIFKSGKTDPAMYEDLWRTIGRGETWHGELINRKKNGEMYWEMVTISPIKDNTGQTTHYLAVKEDLSLRKQIDQSAKLHNQQLALINHAGRVFNSTLELDEVIQIVLGEMHQILDIVATSYWLLVPSTGELVCQQATGPGRDTVVGWRLPLDMGLTGLAAQNNQTLVIADCYQHERHYSRVDEATGVKLRSLLVIPLQLKGEVIGVLNLADTEVNRFTEQDVTLIGPIAAVAASAIKNAQLFKETQQALDQLQATQSQLIIQEKMASLGLLTAGIAHEIKNPLNFVTSFAQLTVELTRDLRRLLAGLPLPPDAAAETTQILNDLQFNAASITDEGFRANRIIESMLLHSREGSREPQPMDINALLDEAVTLSYHSLRAKDPEFHFAIKSSYDDSVPLLMGIPQNLSRVFVNLINNAYYATRQKFAQQSAPFTGLLEISTENRGHSVKIRLKDNGPGLPPEVKENLFSPFFTTKPAGQGTGLGLSISYDIIVQEHGGAIDVNTSPDQYTEFVITLPLKQS